MLHRHLGERSLKWSLSSKPFIYNDPKRVLVAGRTGLTLNLFGSHIGHGAYNILRTLIAGTLCCEGNAEIAQQDLMASPQ